jgi:acetyl esterase
MPARVAHRTVMRRVLSLPTPILRTLAGGGVVYEGGRTLDPRLQFLAAAARRRPPLSTLSPAEARRAHTATLEPLAGDPEPGVRIEATSIEGPRGPISLRIYRPDAQDPNAPALVWAHFGGGVLGDLDTADPFCRILARIARAPVVSVDYRLAPEHRFPAGFEDVLTAFRWTRANAASLEAPAGRAAVGGDSIGGAFAAAISQELKRAGEPQPTLQVLVYPCVDVACESASMTTYAQAYPLDRSLMTWLMGHYMGPDADPADPRLSPLAAEDFSGLAPAVVITAGFDPLVDQGYAYAAKLRAAGVPVIYRCYDQLTHGFTAYTGAVPCADVACREIAGLVREGCEGRIH